MAPNKSRTDLVALLLQFEACADHRGSLYLSGDDAGAAVRAWADLRGHHVVIGTLTRVADGKTIAWTHYTVEDTGDLPGWTVTCALHDDHEVTAPPSQADQQVLARVQAALDGRSANREDEPCPDGECKHAYDDWPAGSVTERDRAYDQCPNCGWTETEVAALKQPEAAEGSV